LPSLLTWVDGQHLGPGLALRTKLDLAIGGPRTSGEILYPSLVGRRWDGAAVLDELHDEGFFALKRLFFREHDRQYVGQGSFAEAIGTERTIAPRTKQRMILVVQPTDELPDIRGALK